MLKTFTKALSLSSNILVILCTLSIIAFIFYTFDKISKKSNTEQFSEQNSIKHEWQYEFATHYLFEEIVEKNKNGEAFAHNIHALYLFEHPISDAKLVELSKYYLGAANTEELTSSVVNRGNVMLDIINNALLNITPCSLPKCREQDQIENLLLMWKTYISEEREIKFIQ